MRQTTTPGAKKVKDVQKKLVPCVQMREQTSRRDYCRIFAVMKKLDDVQQVRTLGTSQANSAPSQAVSYSPSPARYKQDDTGASFFIKV